MKKKTNEEIHAELRVVINQTIEKIIRRYEKKYGITIIRTNFYQVMPDNRIEYPEKNLFK